MSKDALDIVKRRNRELLQARQRERIAQRNLERALASAKNRGHGPVELGELIDLSHQRVSQLIEKAEIAKLRAGR